MARNDQIIPIDPETGLPMETDPLKIMVAQIERGCAQFEMDLWSEDPKVREKWREYREKHPKEYAARERSVARWMGRMRTVTVNHTSESRPKKKAKPEDFENLDTEKLREIIVEGEEIGDE